MKKLIIPIMFMTLGLVSEVSAQTLDQISGTWSISRKGDDSEVMVMSLMGITQNWITREADGKVWVGIYNFNSDGTAADSSKREVVASSYENGKLLVSTRFKGVSPEWNSYTHYEIAFGESGASGRLMETYNPMGDGLGAIMGVSPENFAVKKFGTITMAKVSKSIKLPKGNPKPVPKPAANASSSSSMPMFVPFVPPSDFDGPSYAPSYSSGRSSSNCTIDKINCNHGCEAPTFGNAENAARIQACQNRCDQTYRCW
jgi:hypothetical protein